MFFKRFKYFFKLKAFMKRRIIGQRGSLTITLPKKWADSLKLSAGEEIDVSASGNSLVINAGGVQQKSELSIKITPENKDMLQTLLVHSYRRGYDKISVEAYSAEVIEKIEGIVEDYLLGFGVVEKNGKECIIENITEPTAEKYDSLVMRNLIIIKETSNTIFEDCRKGSFKNIEQVQAYTKSLDKYNFFCRRTIAKKAAAKQFPELEWQFLSHIMHMQRSWLALYQYLSGKKFRISKKAESLFEDVILILDLLFSLYTKKEISYEMKIRAVKDKILYKQCYELLENSKGPESVVAYHLREIARMAIIAASPVLGMNI